MKVQAITDGFYGGARRRAGSVFEVPDGTKSKWFVAVDANTPAPAKAGKPSKKKNEEVALSQLPADQQPASADAPVEPKASDKDVI